MPSQVPCFKTHASATCLRQPAQGRKFSAQRHMLVVLRRPCHTVGSVLDVHGVQSATTFEPGPIRRGQGFGFLLFFGVDEVVLRIRACTMGNDTTPARIPALIQRMSRGSPRASLV